MKKKNKKAKRITKQTQLKVRTGIKSGYDYQECIHDCLERHGCVPFIIVPPICGQSYCDELCSQYKLDKGSLIIPMPLPD